MAVELNQIEQMSQEFISIVSHEIQSPLTSISGFAKALQNDCLSHEERTHYVSIIETESMRLCMLFQWTLRRLHYVMQENKFGSSWCKARKAYIL